MCSRLLWPAFHSQLFQAFRVCRLCGPGWQFPFWCVFSKSLCDSFLRVADTVTARQQWHIWNSSQVYTVIRPLALFFYARGVFAGRFALFILFLSDLVLRYTPVRSPSDGIFQHADDEHDIYNFESRDERLRLPLPG